MFKHNLLFVQLKKALGGSKCLLIMDTSLLQAFYAQEFTPFTIPDVVVNLYSFMSKRGVP